MDNCLAKILVIDDNQDNLISLKALLKDVFPNSIVFTALNGVIGIQLAKQEDPDVILLDIIMPKMDGFEVCRMLKADIDLRDIPVVFVTAIKDDTDSRILALESGAEAFLSKPIDISELIAQIRAMLKIKASNIQKRNVKDHLAFLVEEKTYELSKAHLESLKLLENLKRENEARKVQEEKLKYLSFHDQLTGLYNRRYFEEALDSLDIESNLPMTIIMGDISGLKLVNDSFGHAIGDSLLRKAAETVMNNCRPNDIVARLGGDEIVVILPNTDTLEAELILNNIKEQATNKIIGSVELSISFGYEIKRKKEENIQNILVSAENNMYKYKVYESKSMRNRTIDVIMNTLFEKSNRELLHSKRVSHICEAIASKLELDKDNINQIRIAGLVHDIGKIGIDEKILNKEQKLDDYEWEAVKKHPDSGWRILSSVNEFCDLAEFILSHHERWDGKGYPKGLRGEEISIESRIITVADSYDAMTSQRSYRQGISEDDAIIEIKRCSGTQFDPIIAKVFVEKVLEKPWN